MAQKTRTSKRESNSAVNVEKDNANKKDIKKSINILKEKIKKQVTYDEMINILKEMEKIVFEKEFNDIIKELKKIGYSKRKKATLKIDNINYNNIQVFDEKDSPIMGLIEKIRKEKNIALIASNINKTIDQYNKFDSYNKQVIKTNYIKEALKIAQNKYRVLNLLKDKKIDIFNTGRSNGEYKSELCNDFLNKKFEIFIYTDKDAIYTVLRQIGLIVDMILCDEDEIIPKSFIKINKNKNINVNLLNASKEERATIFADIFAVTILKNTELEAFAPFVLNDTANEILEDYFSEEIEKKINESK